MQIRSRSVAALSLKCTAAKRFIRDPCHTHSQPALIQSIMSDQVQEMLEVPRRFWREGIQFINRSQKRKFLSSTLHRLECKPTFFTADKFEFLKLCQAVSVGFLVIGVLGYIVKLGNTVRHFALDFHLI